MKKGQKIYKIVVANKNNYQTVEHYELVLNSDEEAKDECTRKAIELNNKEVLIYGLRKNEKYRKATLPHYYLSN